MSSNKHSVQCFLHDMNLSMVCKTCSHVPICTKCIYTAHKGHMISPLKKQRRIITSNLCARHEQNFMLVCKTCGDEYLCRTCFYPWHKGHSVVEYQVHIKKLRQNFIKLEEIQSKANVDNVASVIMQKRDELKKQIDSVAEKLVVDFISTEKKTQRERKKIAFRVSKVDPSKIEPLFGEMDDG